MMNDASDMRIRRKKNSEGAKMIIPQQDKDKMLNFAAALDAITPPRCKEEKCNIILNLAMKEIYSVTGKIRHEIEEL